MGNVGNFHWSDLEIDQYNTFSIIPFTCTEQTYVVELVLTNTYNPGIPINRRSKLYVDKRNEERTKGSIQSFLGVLIERDWCELRMNQLWATICSPESYAPQKQICVYYAISGLKQICKKDDSINFHKNEYFGKRKTENGYVFIQTTTGCQNPRCFSLNEIIQLCLTVHGVYTDANMKTAQEYVNNYFNHTESSSET
jgi:hypothetical protein